MSDKGGSLVVDKEGTKLIYAPDSPLVAIASHVRSIASNRGTVIISGESGTGKDLIARALHFYSSRTDQIFLPIDCGVIPETLIEAELFGHEKGAYTGAHKERKGAFEEADKGTLFLDEIVNLPSDMQAKLLRALESKTFVKLGSHIPVPFDVRIIAAASYDPKTAVGEGRFRQDLYHRLNVFTVKIPPLRERPQDIAYLAGQFVDSENRASSASLPYLSPASLYHLQQYSWPGNVRELQNTITSAHHFALRDGSAQILPIHFDLDLTAQPPSQARLVLTLNQDEILPFQTASGHFEQEYLLTLFESVNWNFSKAAVVAGLSRTYIHRLVRKHGIKRPQS